MKDFGKPGAREPHARFDEGRLETGSGLGTAEPTTQCVDSAGPPRLPRQPPTLLLWVSLHCLRLQSCQFLNGYPQLGSTSSNAPALQVTH